MKNSRHILTFSCPCFFHVSHRKWSLEDSSQKPLTPSQWQHTPPRGMVLGANPNWWWPKGQVSTVINNRFVCCQRTFVRAVVKLSPCFSACDWRVPCSGTPVRSCPAVSAMIVLWLPLSVYLTVLKEPSQRATIWHDELIQIYLVDMNKCNNEINPRILTVNRV